MKIVCLILARGGSKGLSGKNIKSLNDKPLLGYILEEAKKCPFFDGIFVSTDDADIGVIANRYGIPVIVRPPELATDEAKSIDAVQHAIKTTFKNADYVVLLNACCPLTKAEDIQGVVKMALENDADSVVSLVEDFSCHRSKVCELDEWNRVLASDNTITNFVTGERQSQGKIYKRNTAIYMAKREVLMSGTFFGPDTRGYIMPKERSFDINSAHDFLICELYMKHELETRTKK